MTRFVKNKKYGHSPPFKSIHLHYNWQRFQKLLLFFLV